MRSNCDKKVKLHVVNKLIICTSVEHDMIRSGLVCDGAIWHSVSVQQLNLRSILACRRSSRQTRTQMKFIYHLGSVRLLHSLEWVTMWYIKYFFTVAHDDKKLASHRLAPRQMCAGIRIAVQFTEFTENGIHYYYFFMSFVVLRMCLRREAIPAIFRSEFWQLFPLDNYVKWMFWMEDQCISWAH